MLLFVFWVVIGYEIVVLVLGILVFMFMRDVMLYGVVEWKYFYGLWCMDMNVWM